MGGRKPAMGYPSRTAAIFAMRDMGKTTREIARLLDISTKAVGDLEVSAKLKRHRLDAVPRDSHRTARLEAAVMDRWDAGMSVQAIVKDLANERVTPATVKSVLGYMREGNADHGFNPRAIASQTSALIAAIRRHHPEKYVR